MHGCRSTTSGASVGYLTRRVTATPSYWRMTCSSALTSSHCLRSVFKFLSKTPQRVFSPVRRSSRLLLNVYRSLCESDRWKREEVLEALCPALQPVCGPANGLGRRCSAHHTLPAMHRSSDARLCLRRQQLPFWKRIHHCGVCPHGMTMGWQPLIGAPRGW